MKKVLSGALALSVFMTSVVPAFAEGNSAVAEPTTVTYEASSPYNYAEAFQKSVLFYELQMSGEMPDYIRTNWKGDSALDDGSDVGLDLTGGWYDAGDNVKFNLPMSYTAMILGWTAIESGDYLKANGEYEYLVNQVKWANDYFIKCHPNADEYYFQVGDGNLDHAWWGAAEVMQMDRPSYKVTVDQPGSAVCAETAASLAVAAIVFKDTDPEYAATCLEKSKSLIALAERMNSDEYYDSIAGTFYRSWSGFYDEYTLAYAWLYKATGDQTYLDKAEGYVANWGKENYSDEYTKYKWAMSWDDVLYAAALLLAEITDDPYYHEVIGRHLDYWTVGTDTGEKIAYTPNGLGYCDTWGALRYAANTSFLALLYAENENCPADRVQVYRDFAQSQIDYALGSTGRSFVCGYGVNPPQNPHHRTASGIWDNNVQTTEIATNRHVLTGALVGGPSSNDSYSDDRNNYFNNEVACDYNAAFTGALAKLSEMYNSTFLAEVNAVEVPVDEIYIETSITQRGDSYLGIKGVIYNHTAWPARVTDDLSFRVYVDISDVLANGYSASDMKASSTYSQYSCTVSELKEADAENGIYYFVVDLSGANIYPGGQSESRCEIQFRIDAPCTWDYKKSPCYQGITDSSMTKAQGIDLFEGNVLVYGNTADEENIPPVANDDVLEVSNGNTLIVGGDGGVIVAEVGMAKGVEYLLSNDTDSDGAIDPSTFTVVSQPEHCDITVDSNGGITFAVHDFYYGKDSFTYTVADYDGAVSNVATVNLIITDPLGNNAPVANDDELTAINDYDYEDGGVDPIILTYRIKDAVSTLLENDYAIDGTLDSESITIISYPQHCEIGIGTKDIYVTAYEYTYTGYDSFTYTVSDDEGNVSNVATVKLTITAPNGGVYNNAPAVEYDYADTAVNTSVLIDVLSNDTDYDGTIDISTLAVNSQPINGTAAAEDGKIRYTPAAGFTGIDAFQYSVMDDDGDSSVCSVAVYVGTEIDYDTNFVPIAADDAYTILTGGNTLMWLVDNDVDMDDKIYLTDVELVKEPEHGTVQWMGALGCSYGSADDGFVGTDTFTYVLRDYTGTYTSNVATVTITVVEQLDGLTADSAETEMNTSVTIDVLANDTDAQYAGELSAGKPANGTCEVVDNKIVYTPADGFVGTDTFTYYFEDIRISEYANADNSEIATVTVTVTEPAKNTDGIAFDYTVANDWGSGFTASISLTNNTDTTLTDWSLELVWPGAAIDSVWESSFASTGNDTYIITPASHNASIAPGATVSFGFQGTGSSEDTMTDITVAADNDFVCYIRSSDADSGETDPENVIVSQFLGGSLRIDTSTSDKASLRLGYVLDKNLPEGAEIVEWSWKYGYDSNNLAYTQKGEKYTDMSIGRVSNLVLTNIPVDYYKLSYCAQITVVYELDGVTYTSTETTVNSRNIYDVATAVANDSSESAAAISYAKGLVEKYDGIYGVEEEDVYALIGCSKEDVETFIASASASYDIPVIHISTENKQEITSREDYVTSIVDVFNCDEKYVISGAEAGVRVRGNSTAHYGDVNEILKNQVPYRIKFDSKQKMLGLNDDAKCKSWVLLKAENNLVMDYTAFMMAARMIENYSSDAEIVLVYVNQTFKGVYVLSEQSQVNEYRVDITEPEEDYTGTDIGYLLELNNYAATEGDPYFSMNYEWATVTDIEGTSRQFVSAEYSVKNDTYSQEQVDFISKYLNGIFKIMYYACERNEYLTFDSSYNVVSSDYTNAYDCISAVADVESMVNMYILFEIVHDYDCGEGSFYMCVDFAEGSKYPRLTFICPWDFNWAYGGQATNKYYAAAFNDQSFVNQYGDRTNPWFVLLNTESWFVDMVKERWQEIGGSDMIAEVLDEISVKVNANKDDYNMGYEGAVDGAMVLLDWVRARTVWLDSVWS